VVEGAFAGGGGEHRGAVVVRELPGAGEEVGVQMGLGGVDDPKARIAAAWSTARRSSDGSTAKARPSPRSSR
jgi:hypothetical protein